jgi:hypothetical protein
MLAERRGLSHKHPGAPRSWQCGNVTCDPAFKDRIHQLMGFAKTEYNARRTFAFLPKELHQMRTHFLSYNSIYHLMILTVIIVGIKLMARVDEVLEFSVEQFIEEYLVDMKEDIKGLCAKIKGKTDKDWK